MIYLFSKILVLHDENRKVGLSNNNLCNCSIFIHSISIATDYYELVM